MGLLPVVTMRTAADAVTIVVGLAVLVALSVHYLTPRPDMPMPGVGVQLDGSSVGVDFTVGAPTLIMALSEDCIFCQESMPFYRRLTALDTARVQIVVAAPPHESGMAAYLASEGVTLDALIVNTGALPVRGTPALLVVDTEGLVTHAWMGMLDSDREAEVLRVLFG